MSLLEFTRPSQILDQYFGVDLTPEDLFTPIIFRDFQNLLLRRPFGYIRPWRSLASQRDTGSTIKFDRDKFQVDLDVGQFKPEEVTVNVSGDNVVTVEGKHEEKQEENGLVWRHFVRKYVIPKGHDVDKIESKMSSDGVLTIIAPRVDAGKNGEERKIAIIQTGKSSKAVEEKK